MSWCTVAGGAKDRQLRRPNSEWWEPYQPPQCWRTSKIVSRTTVICCLSTISLLFLVDAYIRSSWQENSASSNSFPIFHIILWIWELEKFTAMAGKYDYMIRHMLWHNPECLFLSTKKLPCCFASLLFQWIDRREIRFIHCSKIWYQSVLLPVSSWYISGKLQQHKLQK